MDRVDKSIRVDDEASGVRPAVAMTGFPGGGR